MNRDHAFSGVTILGYYANRSVLGNGNPRLWVLGVSFYAEGQFCNHMKHESQAEYDPQDSGCKLDKISGISKGKEDRAGSPKCH